MGYYSNMEFELKNAIIKAPKDFIENIEQADIYSVWKPEETKYVFEGNELVDIERDEYYDKFYDCDKFAELVSKHLKEGKIHLYFTGEDGEKWSFTIYPNFVLDKQIDQVTEFDVEMIMNIKDKKTRENVLKDLKEYLQAEKEKIQNIENIINQQNKSTNEYEYKLIFSSEETRRVIMDNIIYCKTKKDALELKKYIEENGLVGVTIDETEDVDVLDSWNEEYFLNEIIIEKN